MHWDWIFNWPGLSSLNNETYKHPTLTRTHSTKWFASKTELLHNPPPQASFCTSPTPVALLHPLPARMTLTAKRKLLKFLSLFPNRGRTFPVFSGSPGGAVQQHCSNYGTTTTSRDQHQKQLFFTKRSVFHGFCFVHFLNITRASSEEETPNERPFNCCSCLFRRRLIANWSRPF